MGNAGDIPRKNEAITELMINGVFFRRLMLGIILLLGIGNARGEEGLPKAFDSAGMASHLPRATLREIFFMRVTAWPDGSPIHVFVLPDDHPLHVLFTKGVLGVYPFQLRSAWDRLVFSGTGLAPTVVKNMEEMRKMVETTPGGIGYVMQ